MSVRAVTSVASVVLAPNPGPMTLDGTNTWVLREPGTELCVVVDPGPLHEGHLADVAGCGPVAEIWLTHGHLDHSEGAARLAELTRAPVRALDPAQCLGDEGLVEGAVLSFVGMEVEVLRTPGHTSDSLSFVLRADGERDAVLTGDTVLGRGTTVVAHPDGVLADYLGSLRRLRELGDATVLPGHGPELESAGEAAERYLAHREQRLEQVRAAVAAGAETPRAVVERVYADVLEGADRVLWDAAELSVRAQLAYLQDRA
jgi:glyoxylase-like metal-dependent hydrolase (beta-lactamase superfamily II)